MALSSDYPVILFTEQQIPSLFGSKDRDTAIGVMPRPITNMDYLKSIIYGRQGLPIDEAIQYSLLITCRQPSPETLKQTLRSLTHPGHPLHEQSMFHHLREARF